MLQLLAEVRELLMSDKRTDGFNMVINDGAAAGQTVFHLHIHLIPRYAGDVRDPRGAVGKLFHDQVLYWNTL